MDRKKMRTEARNIQDEDEIVGCSSVAELESLAARFDAKYFCDASDFHFPPTSTYMCGNSLGLQPRNVRTAVNEQLEKWSRDAVEGHFNAPLPWVTIDEICVTEMAKVVGAQDSEVAIMNSLTVNVHLLLTAFYDERISERTQILIETTPFCSDTYAVRSHVESRGLNFEDVVVRPEVKANEVCTTESILEAIETHKNSLQLVFLGGVQYLTGVSFDLESISNLCQKYGIKFGVDLAHAVGNVVLRLHDWKIDFAAWCTYKYLNSGPGSLGGLFVHSKHHANEDLHVLRGWWGNKKETRFTMRDEMEASNGAFGWQLSNPPVLQMVCVCAALESFKKRSMEEIRTKSRVLTLFLEKALTLSLPTGSWKTHTPGLDDVDGRNRRGAQLSVVFTQNDVKRVHDVIAQKGVVVDFREPNVMRIAPAPLYTSFNDVARFVRLVAETTHV